MADRHPPPSLSLAGHCEPIVHSCPPFSCPASSAAILVACGMQRVRVPGEAVELDQPAARSIAVLLLPCLSTSCNPFGVALDQGMRVVRPARMCRALSFAAIPAEQDALWIGRWPAAPAHVFAPKDRRQLCACVRCLLSCARSCSSLLSRSDRPSLLLPTPHSIVCGRVLRLQQQAWLALGGCLGIRRAT